MIYLQEITIFRKADKQRKPAAGYQTHRSMMQHNPQPQKETEQANSDSKEEKE